jgi:hypothetical protein
MDTINPTNTIITTSASLAVAYITVVVRRKIPSPYWKPPIIQPIGQHYTAELSWLLFKCHKYFFIQFVFLVLYSEFKWKLRTNLMVMTTFHMKL